MSVEVRDLRWDFIKFVLMFWVVFGHVCPADPDVWTPLTRLVGLFAMPSFFLISGYFQSSITDVHGLFVKYKKSFFRIFVPLFSWGIVYVLLSVLHLYPIVDLIDSSKALQTLFDILFFLKYAPYYIAGFYWYLTALLICIIVGSFFSLLFCKNSNLGIICILTSIPLFCYITPTFIERYHFSFVWFFYAIGMIYKNVHLDISSNYLHLFLFFLLVLVVFEGINFYPKDTFYYKSNMLNDTSWLFILLRYLLCLAASLSIIYWTMFYYRKCCQNKKVSQLAIYGRDTLFIYCSHMLVLNFFYKPYLLLFFYYGNETIEIQILEYLIGFIVSVFLYWLLQVLCILCQKYQWVKVLFMGI